MKKGHLSKITEKLRNASVRAIKCLKRIILELEKKVKYQNIFF